MFKDVGHSRAVRRGCSENGREELLPVPRASEHDKLRTRPDMERPQGMTPDSRHFTLLDELKAATQYVNSFTLHELPFSVSLSREYKAAPALGGLETVLQLDSASCAK